MATETVHIEAEPLTLRLGPISQKMSDREFFELCQLNRDLRIERASDGDLIILPPTGGETGRRNFSIAVTFGVWVEQDGTGLAFDSSTGFVLPNGAKRSPDIAWVRRSRWDALTQEEKEEFPPLCPDFVIELRSRIDSLTALQANMEEYMENGAQLGWLIDPIEKKVYVYRPALATLCLEDHETVSGDPLLPGFILPLNKVWP